MVILPGEKTPQPSIGLDEVVVYQPVQLKSYEEMKKYMLLRRRTLKVYPYAEMASNIWHTLTTREFLKMEAAFIAELGLSLDEVPEGLRESWKAPE